MKSKEIRQKYLKFFKSKKHSIIPSASLMPENDSSTLFVGSGMQPLVTYLLGEKHAEGNRLVNSQKSFRSEDIEEVGDNRHTTFFEMLGNWSLGDSSSPDGIGKSGYFKNEQLPWIFEFLTKELKLSPERIYVTVFRGNKKLNIPRDTESVNIWKKIFLKEGINAKDIDMSEVNGMKDGRIFYYNECKNWWSRAGEPNNMAVGEPGGPDSEIFYDLGANLMKHEKSKFKNQPCHVNCDCGRFIEIGNSVFMEYIKTKFGFEQLSQKNVDFGGGLERITMVCQGKNNIFETDLFINIINKIEKLSQKKYKENIKEFEIIADHLRAATFIMGDDKGIKPSNTDQGYLVRRLIRRAIRYGKQINITSEEPWTKEIAKIIIHDYLDIYPELKRNANFIITQLKEEEIKFAKTLAKGLKEFEKIKNKITGKDAFNLYQTYGFPIEMTKELAKEKKIKLDNEEFKKELKKHQELSRTASIGKFKGGLADNSEETKKLHTAAHILLAGLREVLGDHIIQKGSNITAERLRFDFSHNEKMTDEQKQKVENFVNNAIKNNLTVSSAEMSIEEARKMNAMGVFESKYGKNVKVYFIGENNNIVSKEICGGPHVEKTGILGNFKIKKEQSSSAGIRRIKAILS